MKLAILGATGQTGRCLLQQALQAGHTVVAVVRNPDKLRDIDEQNLKVVEGNIYSSESLHPLFAGCDAVISCLGQNSIFNAITLYSESCKAIVSAMRQAKVQRFVFMSSWYIQVDPDDDPGFVARWVIRTILRYILRDMGAMEQYLQENCQDIDYTSVRPPQLSNNNSSGKPFIVEERQFVEASSSIPRADVARFMLQSLDSDDYKKKFVAIGLPK